MKKPIVCIEQTKFKKNLISRINRIDGQIRGIEKMIQNHQSCDNILNQISSVKSALNGVAKVILEVHLHNCIVNDIRLGLENEAISELINLLNNFLYTPNKMIESKNEDIIKTIENQIENIRSCIEKNECCSYVLNIISSIKLELNIVSKIILDQHVKKCLTNDIKYNFNDKIIDDFLYTINKLMK